MKNKLHLMCGIPGCGKSTIIESIRKEYDVAIVCPDDYRLLLTGKTFYEPAEDFVWASVKLATKALLHRNHSVIIDATNTGTFQRSNWIKVAKEFGVPVICHAVIVQVGVAIERNAGRPFPVPDEVIRRMAGAFVAPSLKEGIEKVIFYDKDGKITKEACK